LGSTRLRNMFIWLRRDVVRPIITREYPCILKLLQVFKVIPKVKTDPNFLYSMSINSKFL
jgi:hypothetical protein